jgi:hypothetical protein
VLSRRRTYRSLRSVSLLRRLAPSASTCSEQQVLAAGTSHRRSVVSLRPHSGALMCGVLSRQPPSGHSHISTLCDCMCSSCHQWPAVCAPSLRLPIALSRPAQHLAAFGLWLTGPPRVRHTPGMPAKKKRKLSAGLMAWNRARAAAAAAKKKKSAPRAKLTAPAKPKPKKKKAKGPCTPYSKLRDCQPAEKPKQDSRGCWSCYKRPPAGALQKANRRQQLFY